MGLSLAQAQQLGIGHLHPGMTRDRSAEQELVDRFASHPPAIRAMAESDGLSKLERDFRDRVLESAYVRSDIAAYYREPINLRLAGRTWYKPDWLVIGRPGEHGISPAMTFVETKGFMRDDASVKLKVAASYYPHFRWLLVTRPTRRTGWQVRIVTSRGIDPNYVTVGWINGGTNAC